MSDHFDTFLSHNSDDKVTVRELALALKARKLRVWLGEWELIPGRPWMDQIEKIITSTKSALILVGPSGIGPWEEPEMRACIDEFVRRRIPVIPVLLPGTTAQPVLPIFLKQFTWVDLRYGLTDEGLDSLQWGITGEKPQRQPATTTDSAALSTPPIAQSTEVRTETVRHISDSPKHSLSGGVLFTVVLVESVAENDRSLIEGLLTRLRDVAQDKGITLIRIERGSTRLILEGSISGFTRINILHKSGQLTELLGQHIVSVSRKKLVMLVHGIRTRAEWQSRVTHMLESGSDIEVIGILYGYFDTLRFWLPFNFFRNKALETIEQKIRIIMRDHYSGYPETMVLAHSFGTYAVARILRENPDLVIDRLLLCGSIVSENFKWEALPNCPRHILNDVGTRDIWPVLASAATWGYGSTGTFGFGAPRVRDRFHNIGHSDFFDKEFIKRYWIPWVRNDEIAVSEFEYDRPRTSWVVYVAEFLPIRQLSAFTVGAGASFAAAALYEKMRSILSSAFTP